MSSFSLALTLTLLAADVPRLDLHGDPLPQGAIARVGTTRLRHDRMVIGLAYSPDGKQIASAGWDNLVRLWDAKTGKEVRRFEGHKQPIYGLAISPDGKRLVSNGQELTIRVWDVASGKQLRELAGHNSPHARFVFTPDGKHVVSGGENKVAILWDHETGKEVRRFEGHAQKVSAVHVSPDGKTLASGSWDSTVKLWELATGKLLSTLGPLDGHLASVRFSPDGKQLAAGTYGGNIYLFEAATGKEVRTMRANAGSTWPVEFSPDGKTLASAGSDGLVLLWDIATGMQKHKLSGHTNGVPRLAYSPDGSVLVSASHDCTLRLWDPKTGRELSSSVRHAGAVKVSALSPDGKLLATSGTEKVIRLWEATTGRYLDSLAGHTGTVVGLAFTSDGKSLLSTSGSWELMVWDVSRRKQAERIMGLGTSLTPPVLSPDGKTVAAVWNGIALVRWEFPSLHETKQNKPCPVNGVTQLAWSPDGRTIAVGGTDGLGLFDVSAGRWLEQPSASRATVKGMEFTADSRLLAVRWADSLVTLVETATGGQRVQLEGSQGKTASVTMLPGRRGLTGGSDGLRLWDLGTGTVLAEKKGPEKAISSQALSGDGRYLVTGLEDSTALVWDLSDWLKLEVKARPVPGKPPAEAWPALAGDADRAHVTIERLVSHPEFAMSLFRERLKADPPVDPKKMANLLAQLDDRRFAKREAAMRELEMLGPLAEGAIKKALEGQPALELRRRLESLRDRLGRIAMPPEQARAVRAVEVLERIGDGESRKLLESLANAAVESRVTQDAKAALVRLGKR